MESWKLMLGTSDGYMRFELEDVRVFAGDTEAVVTCVEVIDASDTRGRCAALAYLILLRHWGTRGHQCCSIVCQKGGCAAPSALRGAYAGTCSGCTALAPAGIPQQAQQGTVSTLRRSAAAGLQGGCDQRV